MKIYSLVTNIDQGSVINLNPDQWLLPETKEYLKGNDNQEKLIRSIFSFTTEHHILK